MGKNQALSHVVTTLVGVALALVATRYVAASAILSPFYSAQLHIGLATTAAMIVTLILHRSWHGTVMLALALILTGHGLLLYLGHASAPPATGKVLRVLSFNALGENTANGARIADNIIASEADFAIIPEAQPLLPHLAEMRRIYPYSIGCGELTTNCDLLVLSRYPLTDRKLRNLSGLRPERLATATASIDGRPLHLMAVHLSKSYYDHYHALELRRMARFLGDMQGPVLLAGDFNATSLASDMQSFLDRSGMKKARMEPSSWPVGSGPFGLAIDHVYARSPLAIRSVQRLDDAMGSNHHPLLATVVLPR